MISINQIKKTILGLIAISGLNCGIDHSDPSLILKEKSYLKEGISASGEKILGKKNIHGCPFIEFNNDSIVTIRQTTLDAKKFNYTFEDSILTLLQDDMINEKFRIIEYSASVLHFRTGNQQSEIIDLHYTNLINLACPD